MKFFDDGNAFDSTNEDTQKAFLQSAQAIQKCETKLTSALFLSLIQDVGNNSLLAEREISPEALTNYRLRSFFLKSHGFEFSERERNDSQLKTKLKEFSLSDLLE